ncbi:MAG TPA: CBS domain-containing protein [Hyphomicrobiaceae bacterium]|jgi:CBS domain-containing protein|nr:CBS domain-containing protein [Hyphomicrobiaceae bacterium]
MKVKQAMHKGVRWVDPGTPIVELARLMREHDIDAIPIGENDRLVGMVTDRDIVCRCIAAGLDPKTQCAREVMTEGIVFCLERQELDDAARLMQSRHVRRLPVINANKRMTGILSLGDLYNAAPQNLSKEAMQAVSAHHK